MIVRGEDSAAAGLFVQVLNGRPGDGKAVPGRRSPAHFIEDHEAARGRLIQDRGGLDHFDHESGPPAREIIRGTDAREDPVSETEPHRSRWHETTGLRENDRERGLAQVGGLARHVGAGDEQETRRSLARRIEAEVVGGKALPIAAQRGFHDRMAQPLRLEHGLCFDDRTRRARFGRPDGIACSDIDFRQRRRHISERGAFSRNPRAKSFEHGELERLGFFLGAADPACQFGKFRRREPDGAGHRLAVDEVVRKRRLQHGIGEARGHLDEVAQDVVELDLQRIDTCGFSVSALHLGDHPAAAITQPADILERRIPTRGDETTFAGKQRRRLHESG